MAEGCAQLVVSGQALLCAVVLHLQGAVHVHVSEGAMSDAKERCPAMLVMAHNHLIVACWSLHAYSHIGLCCAGHLTPDT